MDFYYLAWFISALTAFCVGLAALDFNVIKTLNLGSIRKPLQLLAGVGGVFDLYNWWLFYQTHSWSLVVAVWLVNASVAFCVGLAALGFDVSKTLKLGSVRKPLQLIAGFTGGYSLLIYLGIIKWGFS